MVTIMCPAALSDEPKCYYTLLFTVDKSALQFLVTIIINYNIMFHLGSFDRSAVNLSNLKIILNFTVKNNMIIQGHGPLSHVKVLLLDCSGLSYETSSVIECGDEE